MGNDDAKRLILARRARFVAAALASVAATAGGLTAGLEACGGTTEQVDGGGNPQPCLRVAQTADPQPCLTPPLEPTDSGGPVGDSSTDGGQPQPCLAPPQPCLKMAVDSGPPQPCLSPPAPDASDP